MKKVIQALFYIDVFYQFALPIGAFWYFGYTDLAWAHLLVPGEQLGTVATVSTVLALVLYVPWVVKKTSDVFPEDLFKALQRALMPIIIALIIGWATQADFREWFMLVGTYFYTSVLAAYIIKLFFKNKFYPNKQIPYFLYVCGVAGILSIILFQLAALPVYLQGDLPVWQIVLLLIVWFGGTIENIVSRLIKKPNPQI